jgi:hypothetical protein
MWAVHETAQDCGRSSKFITCEKTIENWDFLHLSAMWQFWTLGILQHSGRGCGSKAGWSHCQNQQSLSRKTSQRICTCNLSQLVDSSIGCRSIVGALVALFGFKNSPNLCRSANVFTHRAFRATAPAMAFHLRKPEAMVTIGMRQEIHGMCGTWIDGWWFQNRLKDVCSTVNLTQNTVDRCSR